jgi:hypothetical protein
MRSKGMAQHGDIKLARIVIRILDEEKDDRARGIGQPCGPRQSRPPKKVSNFDTKE